MTTATKIQQPNPEVAKILEVARLVEDAGQYARLCVVRAEVAADEDNAHKAAENLRNARQRLLSVYAKIATLRHDGEQPKAVPA